MRTATQYADDTPCTAQLPHLLAIQVSVSADMESPVERHMSDGKRVNVPVGSALSRPGLRHAQLGGLILAVLATADWLSSSTASASAAATISAPLHVAVDGAQLVPSVEEVQLYLPLVKQQASAIQSSVTFAVVGGYGCASRDGTGCLAARRVADLVASWQPEFVIALGRDRSAGPYSTDVAPFYGRFYDQRFFPAPGMADWQAEASGGGSLDAYLTHYFWLVEPQNGYTASLLQPPQPENGSGGRYYQFQAGRYTVRTSTGLKPLVQFFALSSDKREPHGRSSLPPSVQYGWMGPEMRGSEACFRVAFFHEAPFTSGAARYNQEEMQWPWQGLGMDAVFAGSAHQYEYLLRDGVMFFVNGMGGASDLHPFDRRRLQDGSHVRYPPVYSAARPDRRAFGAFADDRGAQRVTVSISTAGVGRLSTSLHVVDTSADASANARFVHGASKSKQCGLAEPDHAAAPTP